MDTVRVGWNIANLMKISFVRDLLGQRDVELVLLMIMYIHVKQNASHHKTETYTNLKNKQLHWAESYHVENMHLDIKTCICTFQEICAEEDRN